MNGIDSFVQRATPHILKLRRAKGMVGMPMRQKHSHRLVRQTVHAGAQAAEAAACIQQSGAIIALNKIHKLRVEPENACHTGRDFFMPKYQFHSRRTSLIASIRISQSEQLRACPTASAVIPPAFAA